jgi:ribonucleoside-diphosphate reductase alpha chain
MDVKDWLGKDNQLAIDIWNKKYKFENETFEKWLDRVSNGNQELKQLIIDKKFLFGGNE